MKLTGLLSLACAAALATACNGNARDAATTDADSSAAVATSGEAERDTVSTGDRNFIQELSYAGAAEVELGRLATERAANAEVKRFGQMMVDDHTKAGAELKMIAQQHNIPTPAGLDAKHLKLRDTLVQLRGGAFDRAYIDAMVNGHEDVLDTMQSRVDERDRLATATGQAPKDVNVKPEAADNNLEASLNAFAANTLPVVKAHLERAKSIDVALDRDDRDSTTRS